MKLSASDKRKLTKCFGKSIDELSFDIEGRTFHGELRLRRDAHAGRPSDTYTAVVPVGYDGVMASLETVARTAGDPATAENELREALEARFAVEWEDYLYVTVGSPSIKFARGKVDSGSLSIVLARVRIGTRKDGSKCHKFVKHSMGREYDDGPPLEGLPNQGKQVGGHDHGRAFGMVLDTPQNRETLTAIVAGLRELRERVDSVLTDKDGAMVARRLAGLRGLLPAAG